ncbi:MAG: hypothetical protein ACXVHS_09695 [Methanobacterium sp.]
MATFMGALRELDLKDKVIGFDVHSVPGFLLHKFQKLNPDIKMVENDEIAIQLRYYKDKYELEMMKQASKVAMIGMNAAMDAVESGIMETEIAAEAEYSMRKQVQKDLVHLLHVDLERIQHLQFYYFHFYHLILSLIFKINE